MTATRHVYQIFIKADPESVWQAIVDPAFTRRYFHHATGLDPTGQVERSPAAQRYSTRIV